LSNAEQTQTSKHNVCLNLLVVVEIRGSTATIKKEKTAANPKLAYAVRIWFSQKFLTPKASG
jgi:hypothetical protein